VPDRSSCAIESKDINGRVKQLKTKAITDVESLTALERLAYYHRLHKVTQKLVGWDQEISSTACNVEALECLTGEFQGGLLLVVAEQSEGGKHYAVLFTHAELQRSKASNGKSKTLDGKSVPGGRTGVAKVGSTNFRCGCPRSVAALNFRTLPPGRGEGPRALFQEGDLAQVDGCGLGKG